MKIKAYVVASVLALGSFSAIVAHAEENKDKGQHFMHDARGELEKALKHLKEHPERDFGGHRGKAEQKTEEALKEIDEALSWAKSHPKETN